MADRLITVDLGGTHLRTAIIQNHKIIKYVKKKTPKDRKMLIKELVSSIQALMSEDIKGIAIACPGPLKDGIIKNPPNLSLRNFNLRKEVHDYFKLPVAVENDAKCVAIAEMKLGCRKKNFILLTLGTGIGGGIIINGEMYRGEGYGGEVGHIILDHGKDFESLAASKSLKKLTKEAFGKELMINDLLKIKNGRARKILEQISMYLGQGIASLINVFDPEIVILSGGMKETKAPFLNMIRRQAKKYVILPKETRIEWTKINHPGVLGASFLLD